MRDRLAVTAIAWLAAMTCLVWPAAAAEDIEVNPSTASPPPALPITIDIDRLLDGDPPNTEVTDAVWRLAARPGGTMLELPIEVDLARVTEPIELEASTVRVRGGRFMAWRVPDGVSDPALTAGAGFPRGGPGGQTAPGQAEGEAIPPRLVRSLTILPGGVIQWSADRRPIGGQAVNTTNLYALRLDGQAMRERGPGATDRGPQDENEDRAATRDRRKQEQDEYRQQLEAFRQLQRQVQSLPMEFRETVADPTQPLRLIAVFELAGAMRQITISGVQPDDWTL